MGDNVRLVLAACCAASLIGALGACTGDDPPPATQPPDDIGCTNDPRVTPYTAGLQAKSPSGRMIAEILSSAPSPPQRAEGDAGVNTWTMKLTFDGKPPPAGHVVVSARMPDHGHSSRDVPKITSDDDGVTYTVSDLYLFMGGVWEITFASQPDGGIPEVQDEASFWLCLQ